MNGGINFKFMPMRTRSGSQNRNTALVNQAISFSKLLLLDEEGEKIGIMSAKDALKIADERGYDLLCVAPKSTPPVCKLLDYGKYKYEQKKMSTAMKKKQHVTQNREIRLRPSTDVNDLKIKAKKAREFILEGDRVKVSLKFRGRELSYIDLGKQKLMTFFGFVSDIAKIEKHPKLTGRFFDMYIVKDSTKKKS